jgi:hypothetical protein
MPQYLLSIYQPEGDPPPEGFLAEVMRKLAVVNKEIKAAGAWVFTGGLHAPSTATVVRHRGGEMLLTDGPFAEAKEHIGGIYVIRAPDLDAALAWASKIAEATTLPIEVRPFQDQGEA